MDLLRDTVRSCLARRPEDAWEELGLAGLAVPEQYGGAGCGPDEIAVVAHELGRALSPLPFLQSAILAVEALMLDGTEEARRRLLPPAPSATVVLDGDLRLTGGLLSGMADHVPEGELVLVYTGDALVEAVPTRREPYRTVDESRPLTRLVFEGAPAVVVGGARHRERVRELGIAALAAEQAGGAERCLEMAVSHALSRVQFGRPIGGFQAIKHKLADVHLLVESARSAAAAAGESGVAAAVAGAYCGEAYLTAAGESIQVHGGIGITWEHDAHRHLKRAASDAQLFRTPRAHRAWLADAVF
ncbi:acyl-CoA/acyl-ACP dehydrogenase [Nonomuraea sp. NBC_01738]|uniref:acyl-CoA dehydrogenase family protein n=1 Tax=Nonomuraea sp. NBC_01738 TaxID=2976003 RepID=UPI002E10F9AE|nr:acyl-CoA/acyl-ACP dehydrogenase [Nonomuraea sp. NBC_01738]